MSRFRRPAVVNIQIIIIKDMSIEDLRSIIDLMYLGEIKINGGRLFHYLKALNLCKLKCPESRALLNVVTCVPYGVLETKSADTRLKGRKCTRYSRTVTLMWFFGLGRRESLDRHRRCSAKDVLPVAIIIMKYNNVSSRDREERFSRLVCCGSTSTSSDGSLCDRECGGYQHEDENHFLQCQTMKMTTKATMMMRRRTRKRVISKGTHLLWHLQDKVLWPEIGWHVVDGRQMRHEYLKWKLASNRRKKEWNPHQRRVCRCLKIRICKSTPSSSLLHPFSKLIQLKSDVRQVELSDESASRPQRKYKCPNCSKIYVSQKKHEGTSQDKSYKSQRQIYLCSLWQGIFMKNASTSLQSKHHTMPGRILIQINKRLILLLFVFLQITNHI